MAIFVLKKSHPRTFKEWRLEFKKSRMTLLPVCQKSMTICPFIYTQYRHWTDRRTDRIDKTISRYPALHP